AWQDYGIVTRASVETAPVPSEYHDLTPTRCGPSPESESILSRLSNDGLCSLSNPPPPPSATSKSRETLHRGHRGFWLDLHAPVLRVHLLETQRERDPRGWVEVRRVEDRRALHRSQARGPAAGHVRNRGGVRRLLIRRWSPVRMHALGVLSGGSCERTNT